MAPPAGGGTPPPQPTDAAGYKIHLDHWLLTCRTPKEVDDRWLEEFDLRKKCGVRGGVHIVALKNAKDQRISALKGGV